MAIEEDPEWYEAAAFTSAGVSFTTCRVLEVGCGDGRLTKRYADVAASVIAVDPDTQALAALARGRAAFSGLGPDACFRQLISFPASKRRYYKIGVIISRRV